MNTETLISSLAEDVQPISRHGRARQLLLGVVGGGAITLLLIAFGLGFRVDLGVAIRGGAFWLKWIYASSLAIGAISMLAVLARPEPDSVRVWRIAIPFVAMVFVAISEMARVPPGGWPAMWLGNTWTKCPWLILLLSAPIYVGLLRSFRRLAPTRLRAAGAVAGFASGAWAAVLYCLHCPETSAPFVLTWYTLGMALAAGFGALTGPKLLRW